jgi:circadian clock protein KaiB
VASGADASKAFAAAASNAASEHYELCLFIAGTTPASTAALATILGICKERLEGRYDLVVVDVYQQPSRAREDQILAVPTLLRRRPLPQRRLIGDLSDRAQVLSGLSLPRDPA